jgi:hypothetical protein
MRAALQYLLLTIVALSIAYLMIGATVLAILGPS